MKMTKNQAINLYRNDRKKYFENILQHLLENNMAWCFTEHGGIIDRDECREWIRKNVTGMEVA